MDPSNCSFINSKRLQYDLYRGFLNIQLANHDISYPPWFQLCRVNHRKISESNKIENDKKFLPLHPEE